MVKQKRPGVEEELLEQLLTEVREVRRQMKQVSKSVDSLTEVIESVFNIDMSETTDDELQHMLDDLDGER